jgi:predicted XRE-type DNA-binding protein
VTSPDIATIQALRLDLALQIARHVARTGSSQVAAAKTLGIPQPTLSRIVNGQVAEVSLELLLRIAVRAQLPVVLQTGRDPVEAGAHVTGVELPQPPQQRAHRSRLSEQARATLARTARQLSPEQRLETQLQHSELMIALQRAGARPARRGR